MFVDLHPLLASDRDAQKAADLSLACVHCGFCLSTCPTYREARDERDSPRGRIYLIKQMLETGHASERTRLHLDRCLTCRNCETACPSGMQYGQLLEIGRDLVEQAAPRGRGEKTLRWLLRQVFSSPTLLRTGLSAARLLRPLLPVAMKRKVPARQRVAARPEQRHNRHMLVLEGCVQQAATPATNAAAARVLDRLGISLVSAVSAGCCGALDLHLAAGDAARAQMRRNIDAWWPHIENGAEAVISSATGCGATVADYGRLLADDPEYADRAATIASRHRDIAQVIAAEDLSRLATPGHPGPVAVHTPCSMQHGLGQTGLVEDILTRAGFTLARQPATVLCCGSAGSYSLLQPQVSERLRDGALASLCAEAPAVIASANIGCQLHLASGASIPVIHWIELLDG